MKKKYKTKHDWVGKVIHLELCKKLKFDHSNKWYMHNPESVLDNETNKVLRDFEINAGCLISTRQPDLEIVNRKKNPLYSEICCPSRQQSKIKR